MVILDIQSSPRGKTSASIAVTDAFLEAYKVQHRSVEIDTLNVWDEHLPDFDSCAIGAKYKGVAHAQMDAKETTIWKTIQSLTSRFQRAERIVLGVPMWNFAYPYKLKQLIDLASQRHLLFSFDKGVYGPLLYIPRALVVYTRGQTYAETSATPLSSFNYQSAYIEFWLRFVGVQEVISVVVENTWSDQEAESVARGKECVRDLVSDF